MPPHTFELTRSRAKHIHSHHNGGVRSFRVLAALIWCASTLPNMILVLSVGRTWGEVTPYTPETQSLRYGLIIVALMWAIIMIGRRFATLMNRPFGTIILLVIAVFYPSVAGYFHAVGSLDELFIAVVSLIVILAVFSTRLEIHHLTIVGMLGGITGAISLGMAWWSPESAFVEEGGGQVLAGPFNNSNFMGTVLILSLPFAMLITKKWQRFLTLALIISPLLMGGSTTGIIILGATILVGACLPLFRGNASRAVFISFVIGIAFLAMVFLPFAVQTNGAFTYRGAIWIYIRDNLMDFIPFGASAHWYEMNSFSIGFRVWHAHHILLEPLVIGGLPYLLTILALLGALIRFGLHIVKSKGFLAPAMFILILILAGGLGNYFILDLSDLRYIATGFVIVALLSIATSKRETVRPKRS